MDIYDEFTKEQWAAWAQEGKRKIAQKKFDGEICHICQEPVLMAKKNTSIGFVCFHCRSNSINKHIYNYEILQEN